MPVTSAVAQNVKLAPFGGQTFDLPYHVAGPPGDPSRVFVVEGAGTIRLVKDGATQATPFVTIPEVFTGCEACGLLSMAFAPDYATSGRFYVFYTRDSAVSTEEYYLRVEEFRRSADDPDVADPGSRRVVLEIPHLETTLHNGGQLQFGPDGLLYISVGDAGPQGDPNGHAQSTGTLYGKLLRIDPAGTHPGEYSIPADNPFAGSAPGADEIYAYGLRNPYRFSFDRLTGDLTIGDVGQSTREEIDFVPRGGGRGANFGWNCFEGTQTYPGAAPSCTPLPPNPVPPVLEYANPAPGAASVDGGYVIRDGALPSLLGRYVYADIYDVFGGELAPSSSSRAAPAAMPASACSPPTSCRLGKTVRPHLRRDDRGDGLQARACQRPIPVLAAGAGEDEPTPGPAQPPPATQPSPEATTCSGERATIVGTQGRDVLRGSAGRDVIAGLGGNDRLSGLEGNDLICGGKGRDTIRGGAGKGPPAGPDRQRKKKKKKKKKKKGHLLSRDRRPIRERVDCGARLRPSGAGQAGPTRAAARSRAGLVGSLMP